MAILTTNPLKTSNIHRPEELNEKLYSTKKRTILTADGEFQVPVKKKKRHRAAFNALVSNIWFKDEKGKLLLHDPIGEVNTITNGAIYEMMHALWGQLHGAEPQIGLNAAGSISSSTMSGSSYVPYTHPRYNDGTYNYPSIADMSAAVYSGSTYFINAYDAIRPYITLFGQIAFINGASGGLTGDHIPGTITFGTGFRNGILTGAYAPIGQGWANDNNSRPINSWGTTQTTLSDTFSMQTTGTPQFSHSMVLGANAGAYAFTFDSIAWIPPVLMGGSNTLTKGGYWAAGNPVRTDPNFQSAYTTATTVANLQVAALWTPGYAITLNPGGSWGFTYTFQG